MSRLFAVKTEIVTVVRAPTPEKAIKIAESVMEDQMNQGFGTHTWNEMTSIRDLPEGWSEDEVPFSEVTFVEEETIGEILNGKN